MYEVFEHTADIGLHIRAVDLPTLFTEAGQALTSLIVADVATIRPQQPREFDIPGDQMDYLLFDWLNEILFCFESSGLVFRDFEVTMGDSGLIGSALGEKFDATRHVPSHEVKAITYHQLSVAQGPQGEWSANVIVDI